MELHAVSLAFIAVAGRKGETRFWNVGLQSVAYQPASFEEADDLFALPSPTHASDLSGFVAASGKIQRNRHWQGTDRVAATDRDVPQTLAQGNFRQDLYFRLPGHGTLSSALA